MFLPSQYWDIVSVLCPWARHLTLKCFTWLRWKWVLSRTEMEMCMISSMRQNGCRTVCSPWGWDGTRMNMSSDHYKPAPLPFLTFTESTHVFKLPNKTKWHESCSQCNVASMILQTYELSHYDTTLFKHCLKLKNENNETTLFKPGLRFENKNNAMALLKPGPRLKNKNNETALFKPDLRLKNDVRYNRTLFQRSSKSSVLLCRWVLFVSHTLPGGPTLLSIDTKIQSARWLDDLPTAEPPSSAFLDYVSQGYYARDVHPLLAWCWPSVSDAGPTSSQQWVNVSSQRVIRLCAYITMDNIEAVLQRM